MLDKTYRPKEVEAARYAAWEASGAFAPREDAPGAPYAIMMPPPNVTGSLHMGHALTFTVQDTLIRFYRMRGRRTLWQPGMDHAGIATQMVVERQLAAEGENMSRRDMGREAFVARVWQWKDESGGQINRQLRRLGASPAWSRERFTMDDDLSHAVRTAFVELYRKGLIYRDKRLVNWDCKLHTAISDLEVVQQEVDGHLWHFRYPIDGVDGAFITVATTRPETMLGDTGVAVHPADERYSSLVGKRATLPLVGRSIPIIADEYSDPEKGTGAVKITPAHDFNDFEVGRRHGLPAINVLNQDGTLNDAVPTKYRGLERFEARELVVADMDAAGLLAKVEPHRHTVPYGDRSGVPVEPLLTDQWFCDAKTLAQPAIQAVESGATKFVPEQWAATYYDWMYNIQPWCISRQLWWGHRIPAWYAPDGTIFVAMTAAEAQRAAAEHYGRDVALDQDEDVLDTWFSSALWPFSTLDWPRRSPELATYYPTSVLVTGFDIIFFWVARMMMMGLHFMDEVPFREVYIHGLVRDERGQKMSKTKGNVVDPLELCDEYGADALRFAILASTAQGRDIKFGEARVQGYRNFVTKLWNAARFCELNDCRLDPGFDPSTAQVQANRWILSELAKVAASTTQAIAAYRFNEAAGSLYHFTWNLFCDWYLELAKPLLADGRTGAETRACAGFVLAKLVHLLHPLMPFVTEELWARLFDAPGGMLISAGWPDDLEGLHAPDVEDEIDWLIRVISGIRAARSELRVPPAARLELQVHGADAQTGERVVTHGEALARLARLDRAAVANGAMPKRAIQVVVDDVAFVLPVEGIVDLEEERRRLRKDIERTADDAARIERKLENRQFLERAPAAVVEEQRARREELLRQRVQLEAALMRIAS